MKKGQILCIVFILFTFSVEIFANDVNIDGKIGIDDAITALKVASNMETNISIIKGIHWNGKWQVEKSYHLYDAVQYEGSSYICLLPHDSTLKTTPPENPGIWDLIALGAVSENENDPTVPSFLKDGISWSEIQDIPNGFADGRDDTGSFQESDPTVPANIKDGIKWSEIIDIPQGILGFQTDSNGDYSVAFGEKTKASGNHSIAIGYESIASGRYSVAMGLCSQAEETASIAMGDHCKSTGKNSLAVGKGTEAKGDNSVALGSNTNAYGENSFVVGGASYATGKYSFAAGEYVRATMDNSYVFGKGYGSSEYRSPFANSFSVAFKDSSNDDTPDFMVTPEGVSVNGYPHSQYKFRVVGNAYSTGSWSTSDARYKTNIKPIDNALSKINLLQGVKFEWNIENFPEMSFSKGKQIGLIAQDVEKIIPEVVTTDSDSFKAVSYEKLVPVLVESIKELSRDVKELKNIINELRNDKTNL